MPLTNFGAILNFAEQLEIQERSFYQALAENPSCVEQRELFAQFVRDTDKNIKTVQRTRRENVTEMILEAIEGFTREPYCIECEGASTLDAQTAIETAHKLEQTAESYYLAAAEKIKVLSEVSRALKKIAKKHTAHLKKLSEVNL